MNIEELKGLGPKKAQAFANKEIYSAEDLVRTLPVDYEDRRHVTPMAALTVGQPALVKGRVIGIRQGGSWKRNRVLVVTLLDTSSGQDGPGALELVFFNGYYLSRAFKNGAEYFCYGKPSLGKNRIQMIHPEFTRADEDPEMALLPVYPAVRGVGQRDMRRFEKQILGSSYFRREIAAEYLPAWYMEKYDLDTIGKALGQAAVPLRGYAASASRSAHDEGTGGGRACLPGGGCGRVHRVAAIPAYRGAAAYCFADHGGYGIDPSDEPTDPG